MVINRALEAQLVHAPIQLADGRRHILHGQVTTLKTGPDSL
jgi:hypothetical protein